MFKSNRKKTLGKKIMSFFWPENGWKRYGQYILLKLNRLKGTPRSIAAGVACGVAISFTPFVGFHLVLAAATSWLVRGNILASAIGTLIGNPWTFPFIWISVLYTGRYFLGMDHSHNSVNFIAIFEKMFHSVMNLDFPALAQEVWPILYPMMVGCIPYYILSWLISFYLVKKALDSISNRRNKIKEPS